MEELLKIVHEILQKHKIRYVIIGGIAVLAWGKPGVVDIDIVITVGSTRFQTLIEVFRNSGFSVPKDILSRLSKGLAVKLRYGAYSVDLRLASFTIDSQAIKRARRIRILGITVPVATKEDLIVYKLAHFDFRDMSDILTVLKRQKNIDFEYIKGSAWKLAEEAHKPEIKDNLVKVLSW